MNAFDDIALDLRGGSSHARRRAIELVERVSKVATLDPADQGHTPRVRHARAQLAAPPSPLLQATKTNSAPTDHHLLIIARRQPRDEVAQMILKSGRPHFEGGSGGTSTLPHLPPLHRTKLEKVVTFAAESAPQVSPSFAHGLPTLAHIAGAWTDADAAGVAADAAPLEALGGFDSEFLQAEAPQAKRATKLA